MKYKNDERLLLILDVDETLIHATREELSQAADFEIFNYKVYKRPYLDEFLKAISSDFLVAIWSSASDDYVEEIAKRIIPNELALEFVWGRSRCTYQRNLQIDEYGYYDDDPINHYHYIKPLKKVKRKGFNLERILVVDDSPHKSKDNYGNAIYPSAFTGDSQDIELKLLAKYLKLLRNKENVLRIEKRNWRNRI